MLRKWSSRQRHSNSDSVKDSNNLNNKMSKNNNNNLANKFRKWNNNLLLSLMNNHQISWMISISLLGCQKYCSMMITIEISLEYWSIRVILFLSKMILFKIRSKSKLPKMDLCLVTCRKSE